LRSPSQRRGWSRPRSGSARYWPLFDSRSTRPSPTAWIVAALLHIAAFGVAIILRIELRRPPVQYVQIAPEPEPPYTGVRPGRGAVHRPGRGRPTQPPPPVAVVVQPPDTVASVPPVAPTHPTPPRPGLILTPGMGDERLWVDPRPALPEDVADAIYNDHAPRDSMIVMRLRAMVDSLNVIIDSEQRAHRPPSWVARGADGKPVWGLDPSGLYVAGIKIPTPALALLGSLLPPGNYDEAVRQRHLADMRADLMQAATRAENLEQFRRYVRELRSRKQAERDAERRQRGDTASATP
jgi:hypothetical protein